MTQTLQKLTRGGVRAVEQALDDGRQPTSLDLDPHITPLRGAEGDLETLADELQRVVDETEPGSDGRSEAEAVEPVHQCLDLSIRQASQRGLWVWLAACHFPEFVYHRWDESGSSTQKHFVQVQSRLDGNALYRVWRVGEFCYDESASDPYQTAVRALSLDPATVTDLFNYSFTEYEPLLPIVIRELEEIEATEGSSETRDYLTEVNRRLSTYTLELMEPEDLERLLGEIAESYQ